VGSGPSTFLASNYLYPVGGLIIHSGFSSGLRIMIPNIEKTHYKDIFPNINEIEYVNCPVFIIHGTKDNDIKIDHAK
jgi:dipeptidyl aminopeptidase/acylaminoacyl peptidase